MVYFDQIIRPAMSKKYFLENMPPPPKVATTKARLETPPRGIAGIGTIEAIRQVTIAPEAAGRVDGIMFSPGAIVSAGEPLVQLNDRMERADLESLQSQYRLAKLNLSRSQQLIKTQSVAHATLDQQQAAVEQIDAALAKIRAEIELKLVRAPFTGQLGISRVNIGQYVSPGAGLITLTDLAQVKINFSLPEQYRSDLSVGQTVVLNVDAFPGRTFSARLARIEPQLQVESRMIKIQATADNPDQSLLPGMFVNVNVVLPTGGEEVVVPETAIDYSLYGDSVFVVQDDANSTGAAKAVRRPVRTGERYNGVTVVNSGLKPGETVIVSGQSRLVSDMTVTPVRDGTLPVSKTVSAE